MKKYILALLIIFMTSAVYAVDDWQGGAGTATIAGTTSVSDIDAISQQNITNPLTRLVGKYKRGADVQYASASTITVTVGEIACQNTGGTITRFRANTSALTLGWSDLDAGVEAISTTYYVYASCDADTTTFTGKFSVNSSTPTGVTYYKLLGSFENDASGNIVDSSVAPPGEEPQVAIGNVYFYGTSASSSTLKTTGVKMASGQISVGADSTATISNLPFTSSATFNCSATFDQNVTNDDGYAGCTPASATTLTIINQQGAGARTIQWIAVGY